LNSLEKELSLFDKAVEISIVGELDFKQEFSK
jgi:hypothetical protein